MKDLRGDGPYVHEIADDRHGTRYLQSGPIDSLILCNEHEKMTQKADKYAVEFCRKVTNSIPQIGFDGYVENSKPELLAQFVCQTVWRFTASRFGRGLSALGPYEKILRGCVFENVQESPRFLLSRNHLRATHSTEATMTIAPFPNRMGDVRIWLFVISGVQFYLKLDRRPFPANGEEYSANLSNPVRLFELQAQLAHEVPVLQKILGNMK